MDGGPARSELAAYFLRLGATGFGGPVALAQRIRRDLVEARGWLSADEYERGLALAAACPGPLAYQLGVYCGYVRHGVGGAAVAAVAFALAPFLLVLAAAAAYGSLAGSGPLRGVFHGVGPVIAAFVLRAASQLGGRTLQRDRAAGLLAAAAALVTALLEQELSELFVVGGLLGALGLLALPLAPAPSRPPDAPVTRPTPGLAALLPPLLGTGSPAAALFAFFFKTGCLVFGSGLVIVPFLRTYVVDQYRWIGEREFLDAVAIGLVSPGPVVITATFVGYLVDGVRGATAATVGIFLPAVIFTVLAAPVLARHGHQKHLRGFVRGVTVTTVGVLAGTTWLVARSVVTDAPTLLACLAVVLAQRRWPRVPDPAWMAAGALLGTLAWAAGLPLPAR